MSNISGFLAPNEQIVAVYRTGFRPMRPFLLLTCALAALISVLRFGTENGVHPGVVIFPGMLLLVWPPLAAHVAL